MKVFATGFNIYGQFKDCENLILDTFIDLNYPELCNLELGHSFAVLKIGDEIVYNGAKNEKNHQTEKFDLKRVEQISCAEKRILFLCGDGELIKFDVDDEELKSLPKLVSVEQDDKITKISCGSKISVALTKEYLLFNIPTKLDYINKNIVDLKTGREHCLILDSNGFVYTFGCGSRGQLGHGHLEDENEPKLVEALGGIPIVKIATGGWHSCAVSRDGDLYVWGWNSNGQLGLPENVSVSVMASPHVVDIADSDDNQIKKVACGSRHTIVLTDKNDLYGCGWNKYKQLGIESNENVNQMKFLKNFGQCKVESVKCGTWNTAVICSLP